MLKHNGKDQAHYRHAIERFYRRQRLAFVVGGIAMLGMMTAFALTPASNSVGHMPLQTVLEELSTPAQNLVDTGNLIFLREERIRRSDTVSSLAIRLGISDQDALDFIHKNEKTQTISRQLRPGKVITAKTGEHGELLALHFPLNNKDAMLSVERSAGNFNAIEQPLNLEAKAVVKSGEIRSSLFAATDLAGIPDAIAIQLAEIFSGDIDFHRDLRKGDNFSIVYESLNNLGQPIRSGRILGAEFVNNQKIYNAYWYQNKEGEGAYYTSEGKSLRKAFLRSPLEFSRISSGFSSARRHPILQSIRAHKGIDYAAPTGTRVRAVADGIITYAGRQSGYGNLVMIKHQGTYSTAYGHLNGFASGIKNGSRLSQGDTIGYVGQTGLATGPHLHFEFRVNSQQVNPLAIALPDSIPIEARNISDFNAKTTVLRSHVALGKRINLATID